MSLETMITRVDDTHKGELYLGFRGKGGIFVPDWHHLFPSQILGRNLEGSLMENRHKVAELKQRLQQNNVAARLRLKQKYWWILQAYLPVHLKDELPEEFIRGHYTQQARWRIGSPGRIASLDDNAALALSYLKDINDEIQVQNKEIRSQRAQATRIINRLDDMVCAMVNAENLLPEQTGFKGLDPNIISGRRKVAEGIISANSSLKGGLALKYARGKGLRVEAPSTDFILDSRMPTLDELVAMKWLFLDIEIPYFRRAEPQITWVGMRFWDGQESVSEIFTVHELVADHIGAYKMRKYHDQDALVQALAQRVIELDPDIMSAYNARFDLIKLRESGFPVGQNRSDPLFIANTRFFERIGIKDRLVLDPMRWQKIARAYDINAKLETAAGFEKSTGYNELEVLEDASFAGSISAARRIASYLADDVDSLFSIFENKGFRKNLEDALWICEAYNQGIERVLHSTNSVNDFQEMRFFTEVGIYRDMVPPHRRDRKSQEREARWRKAFVEQTLGKAFTKAGLFHNVHKVYVPLGSILAPALARRFPEIRVLEDYAREHCDDKQRLFFLEQYLSGFARWMMSDYGSYLEDAKSSRSIAIQGFEQEYHRFREQMPHLIDSLNNARLKVSQLQKVYPLLEVFLAKNYMSKEDWVRAANRRSKVKRSGRRLIGNHDVFPSRDYFVPEKRRSPEDIIVLDELLEARIREINDFFRKNDLTQIAREGSYLYLGGNAQALYQEDAPVVVVDEIPVLYAADKVYYSKYGFISNLRQQEDPAYSLCVFEMRTYRKMLECLWQGENEKAGRIADTAVEMLRCRQVSLENLVFFNKSRDEYFVYSNGEKVITQPKITRAHQGAEVMFSPDSYVDTGISLPEIDYSVYAERIAEKSRAMLPQMLLF